MGLGGIGFYLAKRLVAEGHEITIIERNKDLIRDAQAEIDARFVRGEASDWRVWKQAEASQQDYLLAMTNADEVNIFSSQMAERFGIKQRIIRIRSIDLWSKNAVLKADDFKIDLVIRPEELASQEITRLLNIRSGNISVDIGGGLLQVVSVHVHRRSVISNMVIRDLADKYDEFPFQIMCVARDIETFIPDGSFKILPNDHIFVLINAQHKAKMMELTGASEEKPHRILIIGGGMVGSRVAELLQETYRVRLIEKDEACAEELSFKLKLTECFHGDGSKKDTLIQSGLLSMDTIITATGDNDTNIMTSVLAKHLIQVGSQDVNAENVRSIALVKEEDYMVLASALGTDIAVNQKVLAANLILRHLRRDHVLNVAHLHGCDAEVVELLADEWAPITRATLAEMHQLRRKITIGAVFQNGAWNIARGHMNIKAGDKAVCVCEPEQLGALQRLFFS